MKNRNVFTEIFFVFLIWRKNYKTIDYIQDVMVFVRSAQCGNYCNLLSHFFGQNFRESNFLHCTYSGVDFTKYFSVRENVSFFHTMSTQCVDMISRNFCKTVFPSKIFRENNLKCSYFICFYVICAQLGLKHPVEPSRCYLTWSELIL